MMQKLSVPTFQKNDSLPPGLALLQRVSIACVLVKK